jgi:hypothetical protein
MYLIKWCLLLEDHEENGGHQHMEEISQNTLVIQQGMYQIPWSSLTHKSEFQESLKGIWLEKAEGLQ